MKRILTLVLMSLLIFSLAACGVKKEFSKEVNFQKIAFENLNPNMQSELELSKVKKGYKLIKGETDEYYLAVFSGEKYTGGYSIEIKEIIKDGDTTNITVTETSPGKDIMVTEALTYPMDIVKIEGIIENINLIYQK